MPELCVNLCMEKSQSIKILTDIVNQLDGGGESKMDLFEIVRNKLGCEYISDMRSSQSMRKKAKKIVAQLDLEPYTSHELADMVEYLYGKRVYEAEKVTLISFLKKSA